MENCLNECDQTHLSDPVRPGCEEPLPGPGPGEAGDGPGVPHQPLAPGHQGLCVHPPRSQEAGAQNLVDIWLNIILFRISNVFQQFSD